MKKISPLILSILITFFLHSCKVDEKKEPNAATNSLQVDGFIVSNQPFNNQISTTANLIANEQVELMSPISGQVMAIFFKEGQSVSKGQSLIRLDDRQWKAQLSGLRAQLENATKDYERKKELLSIEGSSQEEIDLAFAQVQTFKSQLQQLQVNIDLANVSAPFSGQLGMRDFSVGAFLKQGDPITTLTEINKLKVDFALAQSNQSSITIGKKVRVVVNKSDSFTAKIYAINPVINSQTRTINVRALLEQKKANQIMPGTYAEVVVSANFINDALLIPTQAIVPSITEQTVYVSHKGKAQRKVVEIGNRTAEKVHILNGISEGDTVLISGLLSVKDGMPLTINAINQ